MLSKRDIIVASLLLLLAAVPLLAGGVRLTTLLAGAEITPANVRFFNAPSPVIIHIIGASLFAVLGAFQFSSRLRSNQPKWHRMAGRVAATGGMAAALTGIWMTVTYDIGDHGLLYATRLFFGVAMAACIGFSVYSILNRHVVAHRNWMIRGYAIGMGAGTQAFIFIPFFVLAGTPDPLQNAIGMGAGWLINVAVAEWVIARISTPRRTMPSTRANAA